MARQTEFIELSKQEQCSLKTLFAGGSSSNRQQTRARILDLLSKHKTPPEIARLLGCALPTVYNIKRRFLAEGLESALQERERSGKPTTISGESRARITALACSDAPLGHARSLASIAGGQVSRTGLCRCGLTQSRPPHTEKNKLRPHLKKMWCIGHLTGEYLARMEDCLHLYRLPYDVKRPVVCYDEMPVQLLGEVVAPLPLGAGKAHRFDYEYVREGTANILLLIEPLTGRRVVEVTRRRTKTDYARFKKKAADRFTEAERIVSIEDNLNTHNASSFYENFSAAEAFALTHRFEYHHTPKKGSWLNMAELELSAIARICLSRRISSIEELRREVEAIVKEREALEIKIKWQFSINQAREKLNRHYENVVTKT